MCDSDFSNQFRSYRAFSWPAVANWACAKDSMRKLKAKTQCVATFLTFINNCDILFFYYLYLFWLSSTVIFSCYYSNPCSFCFPSPRELAHVQFITLLLRVESTSSLCLDSAHVTGSFLILLFN